MADSDFPDLSDAMRDPKQFVGTDYATIDDTYADEGLDGLPEEENLADPEPNALDAEPADELLLTDDNALFLPPADEPDPLSSSLDDLTDFKSPLDETAADPALGASGPSSLDSSGPANPDSAASTMSELPLEDDPEGIQYTDRDDDAGIFDFENVVIKPAAIEFRVWELALYTLLSLLVSAIAANYVDEFPHVAINFDSSFKLGLASAIVYFFGCLHTRLFEIGQLILFGGMIGYAFPIAEKFGVVHSIFLLTDTAKIITLSVFFCAVFIAYCFDRQRALFGAEAVVLFFYLLESILLWRQKRWILLFCGSICHGLCLLFERRALPLGRTFLILAVLFTEQYIRVPNCHGSRVLEEHRAVASWYCPT